MTLCKWCEQPLKKGQKSYCCRPCQSKGVARRNSSAVTTTRRCDYCNNEYIYHPNWLKDKNTKYCSRTCKDTHQQTSYKGEGNPVFGTTWSKEQRELYLKSIGSYWASPENKERHLQKLKSVAQRLGHWPGTDLQSRNSVKATCLKKFGVEHPWMNSSIRQKCETTSLSLYGKHTWEIAHDSVKKHDTNIEVRVMKFLNELGVEFIHPYVLYVDDRRREFDFYIPSSDILIEVDGDYWHANPNFYDKSDWDKTQSINRANDEVKDFMAKQSSKRLVRFWETDVLQEEFCSILKAIL